MYSSYVLKSPESMTITTRRKKYSNNHNQSLSINNDTVIANNDKVISIQTSNRHSKSMKSLQENLTIQDFPSSSKGETKNCMTNTTENSHDAKVLRKSVTPKSSPIAIICTPHRSTKTPKKSPLNLTSPKSHSKTLLKSSKIPRKLRLTNNENIKNNRRQERDINNTLNNSLSNSTILKEKFTPIKRSILQTKYKSPKIVLKASKIKLKEFKLLKSKSPLRKKERNSTVTKTKASIRKTSTPISMKKFNKFLALPLDESKDLCTDVEELNNVSALYRAALLSKPKVVLERLPSLDNVKSIQNGECQLRTRDSRNQNSISISSVSPTKQLTVLKSSSIRLKRLNTLKHGLNKETRSSLKSGCFVKKNTKKTAKRSHLNEKKNVNTIPSIKITLSTPKKMIESSMHESTRKVRSRNISVENIVVPSNHNLNLTYDNVDDILNNSCKSNISMTKEDNIETAANETYDIFETELLNSQNKSKALELNLSDKKGTKGSNKVRFNIPTSDRDVIKSNTSSRENRKLKTIPTSVNKLKNNITKKKVSPNNSSRNSHSKANHLQNIFTNDFNVETPITRKVPDFTKIHKKLFANMESIVDEKKRKKERHFELTKSKIPVKNVSKNVRSPVLEKVVDGSHNKYRSKLRKNEATDIILTKQRTNSSYRARRLKETRETLKNVRTNRRFELQMKFLKINV